jgi:hypothetical protein
MALKDGRRFRKQEYSADHVESESYHRPQYPEQEEIGMNYPHQT